MATFVQRAFAPPPRLARLPRPRRTELLLVVPHRGHRSSVWRYRSSSSTAPTMTPRVAVAHPAAGTVRLAVTPPTGSGRTSAFVVAAAAPAPPPRPPPRKRRTCASHPLARYAGVGDAAVEAARRRLDLRHKVGLRARVRRWAAQSMAAARARAPPAATRRRWAPRRTARWRGWRLIASSVRGARLYLRRCSLLGRTTSAAVGGGAALSAGAVAARVARRQRLVAARRPPGSRRQQSACRWVARRSRKMRGAVGATDGGGREVAAVGARAQSVMTRNSAAAGSTSGLVAAV